MAVSLKLFFLIYAGGAGLNVSVAIFLIRFDVGS